MTDYTKATGSSGTMMIRDTGSTVEFWLKAGSSTFAYDLSWGYYVNGAWSSYRDFSFQSGGAYQKLGSVSVTTDQTVGFRIADSGTSGLGGPTTFTISVDRTSAPGTPAAWSIEQIADTWVQGDTDSMPNGGLAIDLIQVRYDDSSTAASPAYANDTNLDGYFNITGLLRGKTYYFWVRTHNAKGYSPWSARTQATTHNFPPAPDPVVVSEVKQTSAKILFAGNGDGGSPILEWQTGYGTDPTTPQFSVSTYSTTLTGLQPGQVYYFWARGRNKYGWGAYSARTSATLLAGAWVDVAGVKKRAVPYVRTGGVWKVAEGWGKIAGLWKVSG